MDKQSKKNKLKMTSVRLFCKDWKMFKTKHKNASKQLRRLIKQDLADD